MGDTWHKDLAKSNDLGQGLNEDMDESITIPSFNALGHVHSYGQGHGDKDNHHRNKIRA